MAEHHWLTDYLDGKPPEFIFNFPVKENGFNPLAGKSFVVRRMGSGGVKIMGTYSWRLQSSDGQFGFFPIVESQKYEVEAELRRAAYEERLETCRSLAGTSA